MILIEEKGERDPQLLVIRQTDHAFLAGFLARQWGNEKFAKPQPHASFCLAVAEHDNGWSEWELEAILDAKTRLPFSFMSIPTATHIALYQKGIERVVKVDHYAGLLASMHASVLYDRTRATMPGFSAKYVKNEESHIANEFVQQLRLQQLRLKVDLRGNPATKPFMDAVPVNDQGEESDLELHGEGANVVTIAPYPFRREPLAFSIMARRVPKRIYASDGDFQNTLAAAQYSPVKFTMRARRSDAFSRVAGI